MFLIAAVIIVFTLIYICISRNNKVNFVFAFLFLDISALIALSAIYVSKVSNYSYTTEWDYRIYMFLSRVYLSFYDITNMYVMCLAIMPVCFLMLYKLFSKRTGYRHFFLMLLPIILFYILNNSNAAWELYRTSNSENEFYKEAAAYIIRLLPTYNLTVTVFYMALPIFALVKEYRTATLKFKQKYYMVIITTIMLMAICVYFVLFRIFGGILSFDNIEITKFPKLESLSDSYITCILLVAFMILAMMFTAVKKPFSKMYVFQRLSKRNDKISLGKNFSAILHKYKNAFCSIIHMAEIIKNTYTSDDKESLEECIEMLETISREQIADLGIMMRSCGEVNLFLKEIDVVNTVNESVRLLKNYSDIDIVIWCDALNTEIMGDNEYLKEAFINILNNAVSAIKKKKGNENNKIEIRIQNDDEYVVIKFKDNGTGIKKKNLKNIFKPFYTTGVPDNNFGIGLKVADDIINKHNGYIYVDSVEGKWTEFTVILPDADLRR